MIKRLLIAIVLLALVAGGIVGFNMFRDQAIQQFFANMPVPTVTVSTVEAKEGKWTPAIEAIGTVNANQGVDLTVETTGIVTDIRFQANQQVKAGDVLLQLEDNIQQAELSASRTQAALDQQALDRARELRSRGVSSGVSLDNAEAAAQASAAQVQKAEAVLQQRQLRAPFSGTIGIPRIDKGQYLSPGTIVATLQDIETMRADFTVPEQQLGNLKIGQPVRLSLNNDSEEFEGEITGIDPKVDPSSRLVSVRARIDNTSGKLTPGQFVQVRVILPEEDSVISLPQTAVVTSLYGDYVFVARKPENAGEDEEGEKKLEARQIFVQVGRRSGNLVEVRSGVEPGEIIVTAGQNRLSNGTPVAIDNTINPGSSQDSGPQSSGTSDTGQKPADDDAKTEEAAAQ
ncbi:efflux RND transporter periplasmic adaptor subunit (plasmid) [Nitratireductor sp. L1-7-SE]|uniref:Efflux RND transporter periplasmic adaptor subunit n=1 Tax=Nitratireductor rhodophyticola TaxID=2854036 RepID=A0ABS7REC1_9HYPH|nr:efflux RND transporter periplasmic adaptor subunit [Nitratireductor rhodophyticola]MBY8918366.1 efflux RND transporter periplasmic adaptor subunit [Nitratireductor rhodophyticola]MBY8922709.1 efflux RND transporter periplasmic adaptor subunit [Nitratireductor rhodophyticola]MEC9244408.1 efflux RND transporter periplasmic adaptor subunit [Pseudomonadota bacterium]